MIKSERLNKKHFRWTSATGGLNTKDSGHKSMTRTKTSWHLNLKWQSPSRLGVVRNNDLTSATKVSGGCGTRIRLLWCTRCLVHLISASPKPMVLKADAKTTWDPKDPTTGWKDIERYGSEPWRVTTVLPFDDWKCYTTFRASHYGSFLRVLVRPFIATRNIDSGRRGLATGLTVWWISPIKWANRNTYI